MKYESLADRCERWRRDGRLPKDFFGPPDQPGAVLSHIDYQLRVLEQLEREDREWEQDVRGAVEHAFR